MLEFLTEVRWSPYAVGIGIGILSWFSFLISKNHLHVQQALPRPAA